jgi:hypothetical protein
MQHNPGTQAEGGFCGAGESVQQAGGLFLILRTGLMSLDGLNTE